MIKKSSIKTEDMLAQKATELITPSRPVFSFTYSPKQIDIKPHSKTDQSSLLQYAYVIHDIKQTGYVSLFLLLTSATIYFLIQNRFINLSVLGY